MGYSDALFKYGLPILQTVGGLGSLLCIVLFLIWLSFRSRRVSQQDPSLSSASTYVIALAFCLILFLLPRMSEFSAGGFAMKLEERVRGIEDEIENLLPELEERANQEFRSTLPQNSLELEVGESPTISPERRQESRSIDAFMRVAQLAGRLSVIDELAKRSGSPSPLGVESFYALALAELPGEDPSSAIEWIQKGLAIRPYDPQLLSLLGYVYWNLGDTTMSLRAAGRAAEIGGNRGYLWGNLGRLLFSTGRFREASEPLMKSLRADTADADGWYRLGFCYQALGISDSARISYQTSLDIDAGTLGPGVNLANYYLRDGDTATALRLLEQRRQAHPCNSVIWYNISNILHFSERRAEAFCGYHVSRLLDSTYKNPYINLGVAYIERRAYDSALYYLDRSIALDSSVALSWYHKAHALIAMGRIDESLSCLKKSLELDSTYCPCWLSTAWAYHKLGDDEHASAILREYEQCSPTDDQGLESAVLLRRLITE